MNKRIILFLFIFLLLSACNNPETSEQRELREKLNEITQTVQAVDMTAIDDAIQAANFLELEENDRNWFVRMYLHYVSSGKDTESNDQIYEDSQLRMDYEQTWKELADKKYGVKLNEERFQEVVEQTIEPVLESKQEAELQSLNYLADALGYSIEEFFYTFDRHHYEKWVIGEELFPILQQEYHEDDNIVIAEKYRMEVIDEMVSRLD